MYKCLFHFIFTANCNFSDGMSEIFELDGIEEVWLQFKKHIEAWYLYMIKVIMMALLRLLALHLREHTILNSKKRCVNLHRIRFNG